MEKQVTRKGVLEKLNTLITKGADYSKFVSLRDGEKPKKNARVMAGGKPGTAVGTESMDANDGDGKMTSHQVIEVQHPPGTTTEIAGVGQYGTSVAPTNGFSKHYDSSNVRVHQDDIIAPK